MATSARRERLATLPIGVIQQQWGQPVSRKLLRYLHPTSFFGGQYRRVHHPLRPRAVEERRHAGPLMANSVDEFKILVVTECEERVAHVGIARRAGPLEKFRRHRQRFQTRLAAAANMNL